MSSLPYFLKREHLNLNLTPTLERVRALHSLVSGALPPHGPSRRAPPRRRPLRVLLARPARRRDRPHTQAHRRATGPWRRARWRRSSYDEGMWHAQRAAWSRGRHVSGDPGPRSGPASTAPLLARRRLCRRDGPPADHGLGCSTGARGPRLRRWSWSPGPRPAGERRAGRRRLRLQPRWKSVHWTSVRKRMRLT